MDDPRYRQTTLDLLRQALGEEGSVVRLEVRGWCMEPLLLDGDRVSITSLDGPPRVGQLVLARDADDRLVSHRILFWHDGAGWLAGDRSQRVERHGHGEILGLIDAVERRGQRLIIPCSPRLDALLARWHYLSWRLRGGLPGRLLEALRWRLVVARARRQWRSRATGPETKG